MNDKILITNYGVLQKKYGGELPKINAAIAQLIAADAARGLHTKLIAVDNPQDMGAVNGKPVTNAADPRQNKNAVDAIYKALVPDYLVILGAPDVIPHQDLVNPLYDSQNPTVDVDQLAYGDIPYACEAPYSQAPHDFIGPTRVVGRIPDVTAGTKSAYLSGLLGVASNWTSRPRADYLKYLGLSAEVWEQSTSASLQNTFGSDTDLQVIPPKGPRWNASLLSRRAHYINCHGASTQPVFYGQPNGQEEYPEAHLASWIDGRLSEGTVVAAECCYGAELYDPSLADGHRGGICSTYLSNKAYGFFGSTTIAYGPSSGNGSADLICQYFLQRVIAGASLGRAALEARQQFAQSSSTLGPEDLKTLAQFNLLADPSIQPVILPAPHGMLGPKNATKTMASHEEMSREDRASRRRRLLQRGTSITRTQAFAAGRTRAGGSVASGIRAAMTKLAQEMGLEAPKILSFDVERPSFSTRKLVVAAAARLPAPTRLHVALGGVGKTGPGRAATGITLVVGKEQAGRIIQLRQLYSR